MPLIRPYWPHDVPSRRGRSQAARSGVSGKVPFTTYASAVLRCRVPLQGRSNSPHKRESSMAKASGVIPQHGQADSIGATGAKPRRTARLLTPTDLGREAGDEIATALTKLLADFFALYVKTKNFHWHVSGPHFRDYHLMFDEQAEQVLATVDELAERVRKIGGTTLRSLGHISKLTTLSENNEDFVAPHAMLAELIADHKKLV